MREREMEKKQAEPLEVEIVITKHETLWGGQPQTHTVQEGMTDPEDAAEAISRRYTAGPGKVTQKMRNGA